jgi:poly(beta-D-mannuronate) lyase
MKLSCRILSLTIAAWFFAALASPGALAAEHQVSSAADIAGAIARAQPGDVLVMRDGVWTDQPIVFRGRGTVGKPITLRPATSGKVTLTGKSSLVIDGEHLVVNGLSLKGSQLTGDGLKLAGRNNRLTDCAVMGGDFKFFIHLFGTSNRVDHCYVADKTNDSPTLQVEVEGRPNFHRIDHNHFGPRPPLGRNGGETIRVGYSHQSMTNSGTLVERNLFDRCDGELEIISNKSCENVYRGNTFLDCAGTLTLRHGNRCVAEENFFLGHHKKGSGGIRVIGEDHVIVNNYIDGVTQGGFWVTAGISDSELQGYFQARNCLIAFNTVVDSAGPCLQLDAGMGTSRRTLLPENITVATNLFAPGKGGSLFKGTEGAGWKWLGNVSAGVPTQRAGVHATDQALTRTANGLLRADAKEPLRAGVNLSAATTARRPLTAGEVGPSWMQRARSPARP